MARKELRAAGISRHEIDRRVATGALIPRYPGVYRVGHAARSVEAEFMAAVKACGEGAILSGLAAAYHYGIVKGHAPAPEVTAPGDHKVKGLRTRWARAGIHSADASTFRGIPITSVPRTLVDIAAQLSPRALARACHEAAVRFRTTPRHVEAVLARRPNAPGAKKLRRVMHGDERIALSKLENAFLDLLREAKLPLPQTNRPAGGRYVDCRWPEHRLTVELDSYRYHHTRKAWEADLVRAREARKRGDKFERYSWGDVFERRDETAADVRALLYEM